MKLIILFHIFLTGIVSFAKSQSKPFKVIGFNVVEGFKADKPLKDDEDHQSRKMRTVDWIKEQDPDVLAFKN